MPRRFTQRLAAVMLAWAVGHAAMPALADGQPAPVSPALAPYPESVRVNFMKACVDLAPAAYCACILTMLESRYSIEEYIEFEAAIVAKRPHRIFEAIETEAPICLTAVAT